MYLKCKRYFATHDAREGGPLQSKLNQPWLSVHIIISIMHEKPGSNLKPAHACQAAAAAERPPHMDHARFGQLAGVHFPCSGIKNLA